MWPFNQTTKEVKNEVTEPKKRKEYAYFSPDFTSGHVTRQSSPEILENMFFDVKAPRVATGYAMDSASDQEDGGVSFNAKMQADRDCSAGVPSNALAYFANSGFIGFQTCAILAQHSMIDRACTEPANDATAPGWELSFIDGTEVSAEALADIEELDKEYKIKDKLKEAIKFKRVFGVRLVLFLVDSPDPDYYLKPFNIDGARKGSYKGISQIDPYWCVPDSINTLAPFDEDFYEPEYWNIGGKRIHKSHFVILRHSEVADLIKPAYLYGGVSVPQQIYERVYAAERVANEAPLLALTKRLNVQKTDLSTALGDPDKFFSSLDVQTELRDNYGIKLINEDDEYYQHETSLADLDGVIMTQYQLVAAIAQMPATKLLGTSPKGFNATGEHEIKAYHALLESLREHDAQPILERHYQLLFKTVIEPKFGINPTFKIKFGALTVPTEKESSEINNLKADYLVKLQGTGGIDEEDIRDYLTKDESSGFSNLEAKDEEFDLTEEDEIKDLTNNGE